ncbi:MAG: hypothetical protein KGL46_10835 [Hyphomicrobiales bacterium]|nr:hypothetical protein [Hyphomicrobiales bacterium]
MHKLFLALFSVLLLAGCQTATPISPQADASLRAAGFSSVTTTRDGFSLVATDGAYLCPARRCGADVVAIMGSMSLDNLSLLQNAPAGVTLERAIRDTRIPRSGLIAAFRRGIDARASGGAAAMGRFNVSSLSMDRANAVFTVRGYFRPQSLHGRRLYGAMKIVMRGNSARILATASQNAGVASRYARLSWLY